MYYSIPNFSRIGENAAEL